MKSLERQLQFNLAVTLFLVMALIWVVGSQLPRKLTTEQILLERGLVCEPVAVAAPSLVADHRQHRFKWVFPFLAGGGIAVVLLIQGVVIRRTFRRLDHIRAEVRELETGRINQLDENVPMEIHPIIHEFNHVLQQMQERLERSRNSLGNLTHALKGPLNLLTQHLDQEADSAGNRLAKLQAERIRQLTERELKRARMAGLGNSTQRFNPHEELPVLVDVLSRIHRKPASCIQLDIAPQVSRFGDREDMLELLGNLLDNACKWARERVVCRIDTEDGRTSVVIEDDGPGRTDEELLQMTGRGVRLDESVEGHGLGLAICKDIVKLYRGSLVFGHSAKLGGVQVSVIL